MDEWMDVIQFYNLRGYTSFCMKYEIKIPAFKKAATLGTQVLKSKSCYDVRNNWEKNQVNA